MNGQQRWGRRLPVITLSRRSGRALALALGLLIGLLLGELGARAAWLEARWLPDLLTWQEYDADLEIHRPSADPVLGYELVPNARLVTGRMLSWGDERRVLEVNSLGFRDRAREAAKAEGVLRLVCIGGSNTYGAGVTQENTWPAWLERTLLERTGEAVDVWNLGVDGYVPRQKHRLVRLALERWQPDLVIVQVFNRGPRHFLPMRRRSLRARMQTDPLRYWENLSRAPAPTSGLSGLLFFRSHLARAVVIALERRQRSRLDPGVAPPALWQRLDAADGADFDALTSEAEQAGAPLIVLVPPVDVDRETLPAPVGRTVDLGAAPEPPAREDLREIHPGSQVYRWYAEVLSSALEEGGCLARSPAERQRCRISPAWSGAK